MILNWRLSLLLAGGLLIAGCEVQPQPQLQFAQSNLVVTQKKEVVVGLAIPDTTRNFSTVRLLPNSCLLRPVTFAPAPYGRTLEDTVSDRLSRIFTRVVPSSPSQRDGPELIFEATLADIGYMHGHRCTNEWFFEVQGSLRAVDRAGKEVWRSQPKTHRQGLPDPSQSSWKHVGGPISQALGAMVDTWAQELVQLPAQALGLGIDGPVAPAAAARLTPALAGAVAPAKFPKDLLGLRFAKAAERPDDIAVVIGNADYGRLGKDVPDVIPAHADAEAFKRYAIEALGVKEGNVIELRDATGSQMTRVFGSRDNPRGQLFDWVRPGQSRVHVYYAGHGAPGSGDGSAYLVPADADGARIELNGYPLETLYRNLAQLPAESIMVVLEACFSGASQGGSVISNASPVFQKPKASVVPPNVTVIAAGAANQIASWEEDKSHGLFTKYFLKGMSGEADAKPHGNGDGRIGLDELDRYLKTTLTYYARRHYGRDQTAQIAGSR